MKLKRTITMLTLIGMLCVSGASIVYAASSKFKQVNLESKDGTITAVGTLTADFAWTGKGSGGAETAIDGDSEEEGRIFVSLFAINKKNEIVKSKSAREDFYGSINIENAKCKKFTSYHQILNANDRPIATRESLTVSK